MEEGEEGIERKGKGERRERRYGTEGNVNQLYGTAAIASKQVSKGPTIHIPTMYNASPSVHPGQLGYPAVKPS